MTNYWDVLVEVRTQGAIGIFEEKTYRVRADCTGALACKFAMEDAHADGYETRGCGEPMEVDGAYEPTGNLCVQTPLEAMFANRVKAKLVELGMVPDLEFDTEDYAAIEDALTQCVGDTARFLLVEWDTRADAV